MTLDLLSELSDQQNGRKISTMVDPIFYYPRDSLKNSLSQQIVAKGYLRSLYCFSRAK